MWAGRWRCSCLRLDPQLGAGAAEHGTAAGRVVHREPARAGLWALAVV